MRRHLHPLFDHPGQADGPPLREADWQGAEAAVGLPLPDGLRRALMVCNGGRLRRTHHPAPRPTRFGGPFVALRDLLGVGYPGGLAASARLARQWDYPSPCVVLSCEGPVAVILDGRVPRGEPLPVCFVDTDTDDAPLRLADDFDAFVEGLRFHSDRVQVAVAGGLGLAAAVQALAALGARPGVRRDHEGGHSLHLPDWPSAEVGVTVLRLRENRLPDGSLALPELPEAGLLLECTVAPAEADLFREALEQVLPGALIALN